MAVATLATLAVAGTALSAVGQIRQANATSAANKFNANVAEQRSQALKVQNKYNVDKLKRQKGLFLGRQKAQYAKSGVVVGTGSPLDVLADTASQFEQDIYNTKYNTQIGVNQNTGQANYLRKSAKNAVTAGYYGAGSTLLTGTAQAMAMGQ